MSYETDLQKLRELINLNDQSLLQILASRFQITRQIGLLKKSQESQIQDLDRERKLKEFWISEGAKYQLDKNFVNQLLEVILAESKRKQKEQ